VAQAPVALAQAADRVAELLADVVERVELGLGERLLCTCRARAALLALVVARCAHGGLLHV
jgi:hypothetical protein